MPRIHFLRQWFNLSDPALEEALCDTPLFREFVGQVAGEDNLPWRGSAAMAACLMPRSIRGGQFRRHGCVRGQAVARAGGGERQTQAPAGRGANGRRLKCLTVAGDYSHECMDIALDYGFSGLYVTRLLDQAARFRGYPAAVMTDNGLEFTSRALLAWAQEHGSDTS